MNESKIRKLKGISVKHRKCILHFSISFNYIPSPKKKKKKTNYPFLWNKNLLFILIFFPIKQIIFTKIPPFSTFNSQIYRLEISFIPLLHFSICTFFLGKLHKSSLRFHLIKVPLNMEWNDTPSRFI